MKDDDNSNYDDFETPLGIEWKLYKETGAPKFYVGGGCEYHVMTDAQKVFEYRIGSVITTFGIPLVILVLSGRMGQRAAKAFDQRFVAPAVHFVKENSKKRVMQAEELEEDELNAASMKRTLGERKWEMDFILKGE